MKSEFEQAIDEAAESYLRADEKRMPGYARYAVTRDGIVRNIMTGTIIILDAQTKRRRLFNDDGQRKWVDVNEDYLTQLFAPVAAPESIEDKFTKEIIPSDSPIIEPEKKAGIFTPCNPPPVAAKNSKKGLSDDDIRNLRKGIESKELTFKTAAEKYNTSLEHARRIYKRQYYPNVI